MHVPTYAVMPYMYSSPWLHNFVPRIKNYMIYIKIKKKPTYAVPNFI